MNGRNQHQINDEVLLDTDTNELVFNANQEHSRIRIEPIMAKLLLAIVAREGQPITREELIEEIWDGNENVGNKALTKNIYKIRKVFETTETTNPIETLPKKGYRLYLQKKEIAMKKNYSRVALMVTSSLIILFMVIKLFIPGIFHMLTHRLGH